MHIIRTPPHYAPGVPSRSRRQLDSGGNRVLEFWGSDMLDRVPLYPDTPATFRDLLLYSSTGRKGYHSAWDETVRDL